VGLQDWPFDGYALLRILDILYKSIDRTHLTTLIGLDLSAAFDTISHSILIGRIRDEFGVSGAPLYLLAAVRRT